MKALFTFCRAADTPETGRDLAELLYDGAVKPVLPDAKWLGWSGDEDDEELHVLAEVDTVPTEEQCVRMVSTLETLDTLPEKWRHCWHVTVYVFNG